MTKATIVSRTCMGESRVCVGALTRDDLRNVRLLPPDGDHGWPVDVAYQVGDVWDIGFRSAAVIEPPHTEDVLVTDTGRLVAPQMGLGTYLAPRVSVWTGAPSRLFDGRLEFTQSGKGYLPLENDARQSVGFWRPEARLVLGEQRTYRYDVDAPARYVRYVGSDDATPEIPPDALVRVSLSRRFQSTTAEGFWLQLSGWYPEASDRQASA